MLPFYYIVNRGEEKKTLRFCSSEDSHHSFSFYEVTNVNLNPYKTHLRKAISAI